MAGKELNPIQDSKGVYRVPPLEVLQESKRRAARAIAPTKEGTRDARAFALFDDGHGIREVVAALRISAELAIKLMDAWRQTSQRDLIVPRACVSALEGHLYPSRINDAAELVAAVDMLRADDFRVHGALLDQENLIQLMLRVVAQAAAKLPELQADIDELRTKLTPEQLQTFTSLEAR
jgi:phosphoenolpyruvate carboxylase